MFSVMWLVTDSSRMLPTAARLAHSRWRAIPGGLLPPAKTGTDHVFKTWSVPVFALSGV